MCSVPSRRAMRSVGACRMRMESAPEVDCKTMAAQECFMIRADVVQTHDSSRMNVLCYAYIRTPLHAWIFYATQ